MANRKIPNSLLLGLLFSCLVSCTSKGSWKESHIKTGSFAFDSSRISYMQPDLPGRLHLEIFKTQTEYTAYLYVHSRKIPSLPQDPSQTRLKITIEGQEQEFLIPLLLGGHKALLTSELFSLLTLTFNEGKVATLRIGSYETSFHPEGFSQPHQDFFRHLPSPL